MFQRFEYGTCEHFFDDVNDLCGNGIYLYSFGIIFLGISLLFLYYTFQQIRKSKLYFKSFLNAGCGYCISQAATFILVYFCSYLTFDKGHVYNYTAQEKLFISFPLIEGITAVYYIIKIMNHLKMFEIKQLKFILVLSKIFYYFYIVHFCALMLFVFIQLDQNRTIFKILFFTNVYVFNLISILFNSIIFGYLLYFSHSKEFFKIRVLTRLRFILIWFIVVSVIVYIYEAVLYSTNFFFDKISFYVRSSIDLIRIFMPSLFHLSIIWALVFPRESQSQELTSSLLGVN